MVILTLFYTRKGSSRSPLRDMSWDISVNSLMELTIHDFVSLTLFYPGSGMTLLPKGGGLCFFGFGSTKSPKLNLGTFLALKTTWKAILNIFGSLSLVARGWQILVDIIVEKFKIFKILSFEGVMHIKWKLRTCTMQIELEKVWFISKQDWKNFSVQASGQGKINFWII